MIHVMDLILVLLTLTGFAFLGSSRLQFCIRMLALQGVLLGLMPLAGNPRASLFRALALAVVSIGVKGVVLPRFLNRAMERVDARREVEPFVGFHVSLLAGILCLGVSFWLSSRLPRMDESQSVLAVAVAFFNIFIGLMVIITRRKALTQVIGYLVMENGVYIFGIALALETPLLVELGILLDVFVAVFVMGIMIFQISRTFDHIDTDQLTSLKD
jgi:hydrogenase-4 component E